MKKIKKHSERKHIFILIFFLGILLLSNSDVYSHSGSPKRVGLDDQAVQLLKLVLDKQPDPGTTPDSTYNYYWAQSVMAYLAAERNGYLSRQEALTRIKGILDFAERCERREGFWFDGYDPKTGKGTSRNVYFQGWWLYSFIVLKNAYPELKDQCERLLAGIDYTGSKNLKSDVLTAHMYNPKTKQMIADIGADGKSSYERVLYNQEAGEGRTSYVAYSYITGDIEPFLFDREPEMQTIEGLKFFQIWEHQNFEFPFLHYEFHDVGYYDKAYKNWQAATRLYMNRCGMKLVPIREWVLYQTWPDNGFPCTEHRESMSFLTWAIDPAAPVYEMAWTPGVGLTRYYDNWNFYWSAQGKLKLSTIKLTKDNKLAFPVRLAPENGGNNPARLDVIRFPFLPVGKPQPLILSLNKKALAKIIPPASTDLKEWKCLVFDNNPNIKSTVNVKVPQQWYGCTERFDTNIKVPAETRWVEISGLGQKVIKGFNQIELSLEPGVSSGNYQFLQYNTDVFPVNIIKNLGKGEWDLAKASVSWKTGAGSGAECVIQQGENQSFKYTFTGADQWAQIQKNELQLDMSRNRNIKLEYENVGSASEIEIKLVDDDGTTFVSRFPIKTGAVRANLTPDKFIYGWGGADKELDYAHIAEACIVADGKTAGTGTMNLIRFTVTNVDLMETVSSPAPAMEIIVNGQREGSENAFAFLARVMAVHNYRVCDELMQDERYFESMVAWVGSYTNSVELARWVHNLADKSIETEYILPAGQVLEKVKITERKTSAEVPVRINDGKAYWIIPPHATHHVSLK